MHTIPLAVCREAQMSAEAPKCLNDSSIPCLRAQEWVNLLAGLITPRKPGPYPCCAYMFKSNVRRSLKGLKNLNIRIYFPIVHLSPSSISKSFEQMTPESGSIGTPRSAVVPCIRVRSYLNCFEEFGPPKRFRRLAILRPNSRASDASPKLRLRGEM